MESLQSRPHELYLQTYTCQGEAEIAKTYDEWAATYEIHMQKLGWEAPGQIADMLSSVFKSEKRAQASILDIGAGTGLVGHALSQLGFTTMHALDISHEMLKQAQARSLYTSVIIANANKLGDHTTQKYDAVVCVGALNFGHISPRALFDFVKIIKPAGYLCFSTREDYYQKASLTVQEQLEKSGSLKLITCTIRPTAIKDMPHRHWLYQVPNNFQ